MNHFLIRAPSRELTPTMVTIRGKEALEAGYMEEHLVIRGIQFPSYPRAPPGIIPNGSQNVVHPIRLNNLPAPRVSLAFLHYTLRHT